MIGVLPSIKHELHARLSTIVTQHAIITMYYTVFSFMEKGECVVRFALKRTISEQKPYRILIIRM